MGVSSEVGKGSVFSVTLPLDASEGTVTAKLDTIGQMKRVRTGVARACGESAPKRGTARAGCAGVCRPRAAPVDAGACPDRR